MNIFKCVSLIAFAFFLTGTIIFEGCSITNDNNKSDSPGEQSFISNTNSWTIMVYLDADNNLEPYALANFNEMEAGLTNTNIYLVVLFARSPSYSTSDGNWTGARLYQVNNDPNGVDNTIRSRRLSGTINGVNLSPSGANQVLDMADPNTLSDFVDYAKTNFPASNYMLILWDHGDGWRNSLQNGTIKLKNRRIMNIQDQLKTKGSFHLPVNQSGGHNGGYKAICHDENSGNVLYNSQVRKVLSSRNVTVLGFDACLMNMLEVCYEFKDCARYLVGSAEEEPAAGWNYQTFLNSFLASPMTAADLCKSAVNSYSLRYASISTTTLSAVSLSNIDPLINVFSNYIIELSTNLLNPSHNINDASNQLTNLLYNIQEYDSYETTSGSDVNIDLWDLADKLVFNTSQALKSEVTNAVISEWHNTSGGYNPHGLALYFGTYANDSGDINYDIEYVLSNTYEILFRTKTPYPKYLLDLYNYPFTMPWLFTNQVISNNMATGDSLQYKVYAGSTGTFTIDLQPPSGCNDDLYVYFFNNPYNGNPVAVSTNASAGAAEHILCTASETGWYQINVNRISSSDTNQKFSLVVSNGTAVLK